MKIGLLTFHDGINHGGFFQAFSTYSFLKENGFDVEIINYKNHKHWINEYRCFFLKKNPYFLYKNILKIWNFKIAQRKFNKTAFTKKRGDIAKYKYDVVIIGSDIVWNYEWNFLGNDPVYFGEGINTSKLISYAPSCGNIDLNRQPPSYVKKGLRNFHSISVRDENTARLVENAIGTRPKVVLDPTLIYNHSSTKDRDTFSLHPFILIYAYKLRVEEIESVQQYAKKNNLNLVSVGYSNSWCDKNLTEVGPFEWLWYFKKAHSILTSTFHGTLFSIKNKKNFIVSNNPAIESKIKTILDNLHLSHRVMDENSKNIKSLLNSPIEYNEVDTKLSPMINESVSFLLEAIHG